MFRFSAPLASWILFAAVLASPAGAREWTARSGGFTVEAELVDVKDGNVVLKKADGAQVTVPLAKLSLGDVRFVQETLEAAESAVTGKPPAAERPRSDPPVASAAAAGGRTVQASGPPVAREKDRGWQVRPDPSPRPVVWPAEAQPQVRIGRELQALIIYPATPSNHLAIVQGGYRDKAVEVWDLAQANQVGRWSFGEADGTPEQPTLSPDGALFAGVAGRVEQAIQVWDVASGRRERTIKLEHPFSLVALKFVAPDRLLGVFSMGQELVVWNARTGRRLMQAPPSGPGRPEVVAISPGGHYAAVPAMSRPLRIIDLRNGVSAGELRVDAGQSGVSRTLGLAFSPEGTELAGLFDAGEGPLLICWRLSDGKLVAEHQLQKSSMPMDLAYRYKGAALDCFPNGGGWLVFGNAVVDRQRGGPIWVDRRVEGGSDLHGRRIVDSQRLLVVDGKPPTLRLYALPKDEIARSAQVVAGGGKPEDAGLPPLTRTDWSRVVRRDDMAGDWTYRPDGTSAAGTLPSPLPLDLRLIDLMQHVHFSAPGAARLLVGYTPQQARSDGAYFSPRACSLFSLNAGKRLSHFEVPFPTELIDLAPDGTAALFRSAGRRDRLDVFATEDWKPIAALRPYGDLPAGQVEDIRWAALADGRRLLTRSFDGAIAGWSLDGKAVWEVQASGSGEVVLSPGRKYLLLLADRGLRLIDVASGQCAGELVNAPVAATRPDQVVFRPDGRRLAAAFPAAGGTAFFVWDLEGNKIVAEAWLPHATSALYWCGPEALAARGPYRLRQAGGGGDASPPLFAVSLGQPRFAWQYPLGFGNAFAHAPDSRLWYSSSPNMLRSASLVAQELPEAEAKALVAGAAAFKPVVERRTPLAIDVELVLAAERPKADEVRDQLRRAVYDLAGRNGWQIADKAPLKLKVTLRERIGEEELRLLRYSGRPLPRPTGALLLVRPLEVRCELAIVDGDGKDRWSTTHTIAADPLVGTRLGLLAGSELPEAFRSAPWSGAVAWVKNLYLPDSIYPQEYYAVRGESTLSAAGPVGAALLPPATK